MIILLVPSLQQLINQNGKLPFVCAYFNYNLNLAINKIDT
jgi:hypothetical protein